MNWKMEYLKRGDKFKDRDGYEVIYQGNIGDFMAFIDEEGESISYGLKEAKRDLTLSTTPPQKKRGWKDLTIEEACVLIKNGKKVWLRNDLGSGANRCFIFGYTTRRGKPKYESSEGILWKHASMYDDNSLSADDYEGLGL